MSKTSRMRALEGFVALLVVVLLTYLVAPVATVNSRRDMAAAEPPVKGEPQKPDLVVPQAAADAVAANRDFAIDLYRQLAREHPGKNMFFSPYSVSSALTMAVEGARGETAAQMGKVLRFGDALRQVGSKAETTPWNTDLIHSGMSALNERFRSKPIPQKMRDQIAALRKDLDTTNQQVTDLQKSDKFPAARQAAQKAEKLAAELNALLAQVDQFEIRVANAIWGDKSYPYDPSYVESLRKYYGTGTMQPVDFKHAAEAARQEINTWVEDQTNQRIRDLIPPGGVDGLTRLVLTNAVYFKGEWQKPFPHFLTKEDDFIVTRDVKVRVAMMWDDYKRDVRYAAFEADGTYFTTPEEVPARRVPDPKTIYPGKGGFLMLELPYKGGDLSMVAIVPQDVDGLEDLEKKLTGDGLEKWIRKLQHRAVQVFLPRFKLEAEYGLKPTLAALGMFRAFEEPGSGNGAQFEGMCASQAPDGQLYISDALHKTFVEVSEKGTEAAAATALFMGVSDNYLDEPTVPFTPTFRADRPFLFLIRDTGTGAILFLGRLVHPQGERL